MMEELPHSIEEIRLLLSAYLDRAMDEPETARIDVLLERFPAYRSELSALKALRGRLGKLLDPSHFQHHQSNQTTNIPPFSEASDCLWARISEDLTADERQSIDEYDFEFISAYHDGEIAINDPDCMRFETQLFHNAKASDQLGQVHQLSDMIRRWGYRQEEGCDVDLTSAVMAAFQEDTPVTSPPALDAKLQEMIASHLDGQLKPQETIELNRLLETDSAAKSSLHALTRLSNALQDAKTNWENDAPVEEIWPAVQQKLQAEGLWLTASQLRRREWQKPFWLAAPMAAAAALLLVSWPSLQINELMGWTDTSHDAGSSSSQMAIASLPETTASDRFNHRNGLDDGLDRLSQPRSSEPLPLFASNTTSAHPSRFKTFKTIAPPSHPLIDPVTRQLALRRKGSMTDVPGQAAKKAPSSEEYFFKALEERASNQDVSNILGD